MTIQYNPHYRYPRSLLVDAFKRCILIGALIPFMPLSAQPRAADVKPCREIPVRPASVTAYFRSLLVADAPRVARPEQDLSTYQAANDAAKATDWANLCRYQLENLRLAAAPHRDRRIVYIGDSITEAWGISDPAFFSHGRINRGISGQTTGQMLLRFEADVVGLHPSVVHILAGTNDIAGNEGPESLDDIRNNLAAMVTLAKANGIRIVLASVTPARAFPWKPGVTPALRIRALNGWLKSYAARSGETYVDYHTLLAAPDDGMLPALTFDGVHLNGAGYARIKARSAAATASH